MTSSADIYNFTIDPSSDTAPANVLRFVGPNKEVLEIGAGPGSISKPLVELNCCKLTALELDEKSVRILEGFCERVVQFDLNDPDWVAQFEGKQFERVVIADVLEHLVDPWFALRQASSLLTDTGSVVVSLPHAGHAAILACLVSNNFEYHDWGLLDRTHIRFFGIQNIQDLFDQADLKILEFAFVLQKPEDTEFAHIWAKIPKRKRVVLEDGDFSHVFQVVLRAVRKDVVPDLPGINLVEQSAPRTNKLKYVAFYLPQFHPIPENDQWWGKGFTEWTNVSKAEPLFHGHYQPHRPTDFGYYDLRIREVQHDQIAYAKRFGVDAFCFHYYWFAGRRLLEKPLLEFLADAEAKIEFCLCWANENWSRRWDASEHEVLVEQTYSIKNDMDFIEALLPFFTDRRYLRVQGAPMLIVYRPQHMPDPKATATRWREFCRANGIGEIHLVAALTHGNRDFERFGFDAGVEFPPHNISVPNMRDRVASLTEVTGYIAHYRDIAIDHIDRDYSRRRVYRTVFPCWDNTPRLKNRAIVVLDSIPENYERWLDAVSAKTVEEREPGDRLVFINAWNEWAEGCHLEPDGRFGAAFLEATERVKAGKSNVDPEFPEPVIPLPPAIEVVSYGLRTELGMWGARKFARLPLAYKVGRGMYRMLIKR